MLVFRITAYTSIHTLKSYPKLTENSSDSVGPMLNPPHMGELIRESMDVLGWNVSKTAKCLEWDRTTLSRVLNGRTGVSVKMALALERIGWGTAEHWMRMQASYELARARQAERGELNEIKPNREFDG